MEKAQKIRHRLVSPVLMWVIVAVGIFVLMRLLPSREIFAEVNLFIFIALLAAMYWLYFFAGAIQVHRKAPASVAGIEKLVTEGVYGMVRHPIYAADIIFAWGLFLLFPQVRVLFSVLWLTMVLFGWMILEEKALEEKFGEQYREYKKRVPMVLPKFRNK